MEFLADYGLFLLKAVTIAAVIILVIAASRNSKDDSLEGEVSLTALNKAYREQTDMLKQTLEVEKKKSSRKDKKQKKQQSKDDDHQLAERPRMFVLSFEGDIEASQVEELREQITAVLSVASEKDSVLINLESPGGAVTGYGLAASQLKRITAAGIELKVAVDRVAASGGYLMALNANHIYAAPFAVIGSIGVVAQLPNIHRLLKQHNVDIEMHTAGEYKRTLTVLGENTDEGREKFKQDLAIVHELFKEEVTRGRPSIDIDQVSTGEYWYGEKALELGLIDELKTSDDIIIDAYSTHAVYKVDFELKQTLADKISDLFGMTLTKVVKQAYGWAMTRGHQH